MAFQLIKFMAIQDVPRVDNNALHAYLTRISLILKKLSGVGATEDRALLVRDLTENSELIKSKLGIV